MFEDYKREVILYYEKKKHEGRLNPNLHRHTTASLKKECIDIFASQYSDKDEHIFTAIFGKKNNAAEYLSVVKGADPDIFRPLSNFLKGKITRTNDRNIELLSWLIGFDQRPYEFARNNKANRMSDKVEDITRYYSYCYNSETPENDYQLKLIKSITTDGLEIYPTNELLFSFLYRLLMKGGQNATIGNPLFSQEQCLEYHYIKCELSKVEFLKYTKRMFLSSLPTTLTPLQDDVSREILNWFKGKESFKADHVIPSFKNSLYFVPDWKEVSWQYNTRNGYQNKQDLIAVFWNSYIEIEQKFENYYSKYQYIDSETLNNLIFEFRKNFPKHGRLENINYYDDLIELLINKYNIKPVLKPAIQENSNDLFALDNDIFNKIIERGKLSSFLQVTAEPITGEFWYDENEVETRDPEKVLRKSPISISQTRLANSEKDFREVLNRISLGYDIDSEAYQLFISDTVKHVNEIILSCNALHDHHEKDKAHYDLLALGHKFSAWLKTSVPSNEFSDNVLLQQSMEKFIEMGESNIIEFKSTLRVDLKTGKPEKFIEHQVLKTIAAFLNTNGGVLLIGVQDDKNIIGLQADFDSFSKADKLDEFKKHFDNLIANSIGNRYHRNLKIDFPVVDGLTICQVKILDKSHDEIFINNNKGHETFYIRRQASTIELRPSESAKYIRDHWNNVK